MQRAVAAGVDCGLCLEPLEKARPYLVESTDEIEKRPEGRPSPEFRRNWSLPSEFGLLTYECPFKWHSLLPTISARLSRSRE
jgi:hypothetical protein